MATVLRVKRRNDEEPLDALVIACKKRKTDAGASNDVDDETSLTAVVKFAGTLDNQEDDVVEHLQKTLSKNELKANYKARAIDLTNKARLKTQAESRASRYKVVNMNRSIDPGALAHKGSRVEMVIDVEDAAPCADEADVPTSEQEVGYVYDVYYTHEADYTSMDEAELSILTFDPPPGIDPWTGAGGPDSCESEDSNSESNWRNDYPDSDHSANSIGDEDMQEAVRKMKLDGDSSDLSVDDEDFVYSVDQEDVDAYGFDYAKFKARVKEEMNDEEDSDKSQYSLNSEPSDEDKDS